MKKIIILFLSLCASGFAQEMYLHNNLVHIDSCGVVSGGMIGFEANLSAPDTTITTDADTWYELEGTFTPQEVHEFDITSDTLEYIGERYKFALTGVGTVSSDVNATNIFIGVSVNGADPIACAQQQIYIKEKDTFQSNMIRVRFYLNSGDKLVAMVMSDKTGAGIAGKCFTYDISRILR